MESERRRGLAQSELRQLRPLLRGEPTKEEKALARNQHRRRFSLWSPDLSRRRRQFAPERSLDTRGVWSIFARLWRCCHVAGPIARGKQVFFVFWAPREENFPGFVKTTLARHFFGNARCATCSADMSSFQTRRVSQFDRTNSLERSYIVCGCSYPVWQMSYESYVSGYWVMENNRKAWERRRHLAQSGGKHTTAEIRQIIDCQKGRCIYCHRLFTKELTPSKDHLLPVILGGSDWALNIVLACRRCNSSRCHIPFRTYCILLSPRQNKRILINLGRRFMALDLSTIPDEALVCFEKGLASHQPKHPRYCEMKGRADRYVKTKKLLPRGTVAMLRRYIQLPR
jgi:hypothetical protein